MDQSRQKKDRGPFAPASEGMHTFIESLVQSGLAPEEIQERGVRKVAVRMASKLWGRWMPSSFGAVDDYQRFEDALMQLLISSDGSKPPAED